MPDLELTVKQAEKGARTMSRNFIGSLICWLFLGIVVLIAVLVWQGEVNEQAAREERARQALVAQQQREAWERAWAEWRWQNPQVTTGTPQRIANPPSADADERWLMTGGPGDTLSTRARKEWSGYYGAARAAGYDAAGAETVAGEMMAKEHPLW